MRKFKAFALAVAAATGVSYGVVQVSGHSAPSQRLVISYYIEANGAGLLVANLRPDGAGQYSWQRCAVRRACVTAPATLGGQFLNAGRAEPGTTFVATGVSPAGRSSARSRAYRGVVRAVRPPHTLGVLRVGALIKPVAATWVGGWGEERDHLQIQACRTRSGPCVVLADSIYTYVSPCPGAVAIPDPRYVHWFLRVVDQRIADDEEASPIKYGAGHFPALAPDGNSVAAAVVGQIQPEHGLPRQTC